MKDLVKNVWISPDFFDHLKDRNQANLKQRMLGGIAFAEYQYPPALKSSKWSVKQ